VLALSAILWRRRRQAPAGLTCWVLYLVLIAPVCGLAQAGPHFAADRYSYLACLPLAGLFGGLLALPPTSGGRRGAAGIAVLALAGLGALTVRQCGYWRNSIALWDRAIAVEPDVYFSLQNRGSAKMEAQDLAGALADYDRAIELNPRYPNSWYGRGI